MPGKPRNHSEPAALDAPRSRIMIVDDHPIVRQGLGQLIAQDATLEVCGEASDAAEAMRLCGSAHPHLVIIDISLRSGNGIELIKQVKAQYPSVKMLVSSMHDESVYAERALRAGAMGYVNKAEAAEKVLVAIHEILGGRLYLSPQLADKMLHRMVATGEPGGKSAVETLSDRELEVFEMIGRGMTTREIAAKIHLSPKTVETYRENIKKKLDLSNATELTRHAVQWVLDDSSSHSAS